MESEKIKNIIIGIVATATIAGGVVILFDTKEPMSYEEYQTLIEVYNYEIEKAGGKITLNLVKNNVIELLNQKLLSDSVMETKDIIINDEILTPEDYQLLKSGLFKKSEY